MDIPDTHQFLELGLPTSPKNYSMFWVGRVFVVVADTFVLKDLTSTLPRRPARAPVVLRTSLVLYSGLQREAASPGR